MARIFETEGSCRRIIKLTTNDVMSVVREYQQNIHGKSDYTKIRDTLENIAIFIPEDI